MICFLGKSHAARTLRLAAEVRKIPMTDEPKIADVVFISEDTPTRADGVRDLAPIIELIGIANRSTLAPIVLTSQVPPGFTRARAEAHVRRHFYHMAETLRIKDAFERALNPEQFIIGVADPETPQALPHGLQKYLDAHRGAKVNVMSYEDAEFAKIAINMFLAAQVDTTNRLAAAAHNVGAKWERVVEVLKNDKRIGRHAYLTPGRWQESSHLLRDHVTLEAILAR